MLADLYCRWKRTLYALFESPTSSPSAFIIHITSTGLIAFSAFITILETLPPFHSTPTSVWFGIETALVVIFTVEYIGRLLAHSETWSGLFKWGRCVYFIPAPLRLSSTPNLSLFCNHRLACYSALLHRARRSSRHRKLSPLIFRCLPLMFLLADRVLSLFNSADIPFTARLSAIQIQQHHPSVRLPNPQHNINLTASLLAPLRLCTSPSNALKMPSSPLVSSLAWPWWYLAPFCE